MSTITQRKLEQVLTTRNGDHNQNVLISIRTTWKRARMEDKEKGISIYIALTPVPKHSLCYVVCIP